MPGEYDQEAQSHRPADCPGAQPGAGGGRPGLHSERLRRHPGLPAGPQQQAEPDTMVIINMRFDFIIVIKQDLLT